MEPDLSTEVDHVKEVKNLQVSTLVDGSLIYGREDEKKKIIELVLGDNHSRVICIVGEYGAGKSTLLNLVYNDQTVSHAFDTKVFLCIFEKFDESRFLKEVLRTLTGSFHDIPDPSILKDIVKEELMDNKILFVFENANHQSQLFWKCVSELLSGSANGSVAMVTSGVEVCDDNYINQMIFHRLNNLSDNDSWAIFKNHAFGGHDQIVDPDLKEIGELLLSKCNHNPMCIRVLGALLSYSNNNKQQWLNILKSEYWESHQFGGETLPALRVCYGLMPAHLKKCFCFCSLFPKDYIFAKHYIIHLWMAQGLLMSEGQTEEPEDIGIQYFDELVQRSIFQHSPLVNAKEDQFVVHELIHSLAECVARDECFRYDDELCSVPETVHHLSLVSFVSQTIKLRPIIEKAKDLQTCLVVTRPAFELGFFSPIPNSKELSDLFLEFNGLKTLDLSNTDMAGLPDSIKELNELCFIALNNTKIKQLPKELCTIDGLLTIEARNCRNLVELPKEMYKLKKLRHLDVSKESGHVLMPEKIGELIDLQTLSTFHVGSNPSYSSIGELENLNGLMGHLEITGLDNIKDSEAEKANLENKSKMESLSLEWSSGRLITENETEQVKSAEKVLENLKPTKNLKELIIRYYTGCRFPLFSYPMLDSIILDGCSNCKEFPDLSQLPSLRYLSVQKMPGVKTLGIHGTKEFPRFPSLELLNLWHMYCLEELFEVKHGDVPKLHTISIYRCPVLRKIPSIPSLVELSFNSCFTIPDIEELPSLALLKFENFQNTKSIHLPKELPMLKQLELSYCTELSSIEGLSGITSIKKIVVVGCPKVDLVSNLKQNNFKGVNVTSFREEYSIQTSPSQHESQKKQDRDGDGPLIMQVDPDHFNQSKMIPPETEGLLLTKEKEIKELQAELNTTRSKLKEHEKLRHEESQQRHKAEKDSLEKLKEIENLQSLLAIEKENSTKVEGELKRLQIEAHQESQQHDNTKRKLFGISTELNENKGLLATEKEKVAIKEVELNKLKKEVCEASQQLEKTKQELSEALTQLKNSFTDKTELERQLAESKTLIKKLQSKKDDAIKERDQAFDKLVEFYQTKETVMEFTRFSQGEITAATNNFAASEKIAEAYNTLYKGSLRHTPVAIKMLKFDEVTKVPDKEFNQEVEILGMVRHPNIVSLIGACTEAHALVYEYVPNGSLDSYLLRGNNNRELAWKDRIRIASEICSALIFLHAQNIAHGALKLENVLLDSNLVSKLSDFGTARKLGTSDQTINPVHQTRKPQGTMSYIDPEYLAYGELTAQSDVFSFGVILLQFVTGRDSRGLRSFVEQQVDNKNFDKLVDISAGKCPIKDATELAKLGLKCTNQMRRHRPNLVNDVWPILESMKPGATSRGLFKFGRK